MSIELIKSRLNDCDCYSLVDDTTRNLFSFFPQLGCCLHELELGGKKIFRSIDPNNFDEMVHRAYNGAQLFPFPNRLAGGIYHWKGKKYTFELNDKGRPNALHGLLTQKEFDIIDRSAEGQVSAKYAYRNDHSGYPFDIDIINTFRLDKTSLDITTTIKNEGNVSAPVAHGWHPYFNGLDAVDNCSLVVPEAEMLIVDDYLLPTGETKKFSEFANGGLIGKQELDSCLHGHIETIEFQNPSEDMGIRILFGEYPFIQMFIPPDRKSIAIEPQTCAPNAFNNLNGLIELEPQKSREFFFRIELM